jgi:hypothetical protein
MRELRRQGHPQEGGQSGSVPTLRRDRDQAVSAHASGAPSGPKLIDQFPDRIDDRASDEEQDQPDRIIELLLEFGYGLRSLPRAHERRLGERERSALSPERSLSICTRRDLLNSAAALARSRAPDGRPKLYFCICRSRLPRLKLRWAAMLRYRARVPPGAHACRAPPERSSAFRRCSAPFEFSS